MVATTLDRPDTLTDTEIIGELRQVSKSYSTEGGREYKVLDQIDLAVKEGELLALLGQSVRESPRSLGA